MNLEYKIQRLASVQGSFLLPCGAANRGNAGLFCCKQLNDDWDCKYRIRGNERRW